MHECYRRDCQRRGVAVLPLAPRPRHAQARTGDSAGNLNCADWACSGAPPRQFGAHGVRNSFEQSGRMSSSSNIKKYQDRDHVVAIDDRQTQGVPEPRGNGQ